MEIIRWILKESILQDSQVSALSPQPSALRPPVSALRSQISALRFQISGLSPLRASASPCQILLDLVIQLRNVLSIPYEALTPTRLRRALHRLSELATAEGVVLELALYGGAVFTLVYGSRETTKDVDGIIRPADIGQRLITQISEEQDLPKNWLNGDVRQFLSPHDQRRPFPSKEFEPGLNITIPTAAYLLSLKLNSCRQPLPGYLGDEADIRFLLGKIRPTSVVDIEDIQDRFFPGEGLHARALELIEEYLEKHHEGPT